MKLAPQCLAVLRQWHQKYCALQEAAGEHWVSTPYVFVRDNGSCMHPDSITGWLNKFSQQHNLPHIHPHAFRHTAASTMIANGVDLVTAARELGHSSPITCCGKHYRRKMKKSGPVWICTTYNTLGKASCPSKAIPETVLDSLIDEMGGISEITDIHAHNDNSLVLTLSGGEQIVKLWQDRSRRQSWTPEMKEAARQKAMERRAYQNAC